MSHPISIHHAIRSASRTPSRVRLSRHTRAWAHARSLLTNARSTHAEVDVPTLGRVELPVGLFMYVLYLCPWPHRFLDDIADDIETTPGDLHPPALPSQPSTPQRANLSSVSRMPHRKMSMLRSRVLVWHLRRHGGTMYMPRNEGQR